MAGDNSLDDAAAAIRASMSATERPKSSKTSLDEATLAVKASFAKPGAPKDDKEIKAPVPEARGLGVVVLHPGSLDLRIGMAWDKKPKLVKHCVARRVSEKRAPATHTPQTTIAGTWSLDDELRQHELLVVETRLKEERDRCKDIHSRPSKKARTLQSVSALKKPATTEMKSPPFPEPPGHSWTNVTAQPPHVFGEEALFIPTEEPYEVVWPLQRGHFNPKLGVATVCNMLDLIWTNAIQTKLALAQKDFGQYAVALIVRDTINRKEVAEMVHVLLRRMRFRSVFVLQESVAAGFGTGIATGCVVDLGHQTTSVCCIEDGYSLPATRLEMPFGGDDISHTLQWLLRRVGACQFFVDADEGAAPESGPVDIGGDMRNYQDAVMYHRMKEDLCELMYINVATGQQQKGQYETRVIRQPSPTDRPKQWSMKNNLLHQVAAMSLYHPRLSEPLVGALTTQKGLYSLEQSDEATLSVPAPPTLEKKEDKKDDDEKKEEKKEEKKDLIVGSHGGDGHVVPPMALEEAIMMSISRVGRTELKKKLFNTILLVGGGANMKGLVGSIEDRLIRKLEGTTEQVESVEVLNRTRDISTSMFSWRGGAIAAQSDAAKEMYILEKEWSEGGTRYLREKAPFGFS